MSEEEYKTVVAVYCPQSSHFLWRDQSISRPSPFPPSPSMPPFSRASAMLSVCSSAGQP